MKTAKAYFDGQTFVPITPIKAEMNQIAIITLLDGLDMAIDDKAYLEFAGALAHDDYLELVEMLKDTEQVDDNAW